jgi:hypothetical protein
MKVFFAWIEFVGGGDDGNVLLPIAGPAGLRILSCTPIDLPDDLGAALKAKVLAHGFFTGRAYPQVCGITSFHINLQVVGQKPCSRDVRSHTHAILYLAHCHQLHHSKTLSPAFPSSTLWVQRNPIAPVHWRVGSTPFLAQRAVILGNAARV